jgi:hypothetical protein
METDDDDNAARPEAVGEHVFDKHFEMLELPIDRDPQRLKNARGGMAPRHVCPPARGRPRFRSAPGNGFGQIAACANRLSRAPFHDLAGDPATVRFFPIALEDFCELRFVETRDEPCGRFSLPCVKSQIERSLRAKTESAGGIGQLIGRQPQVEQNAIHGRDAAVGQNLSQIGIAGLMEVTRKARELKGCNVQHQGVAVKTD